MSHLNHEHYHDPTAGIALGNVNKRFRVVQIETDAQRKHRKREEAAKAARVEQERIAVKRNRQKNWHGKISTSKIKLAHWRSFA